MVQVCPDTFMNTFGITKKSLEIVINKRKMGNENVAETNGGFRGRKYTEDIRKIVRDHTNSIPRQEGHSEKRILEKRLKFCFPNRCF